MHLPKPRTHRFPDVLKPFGPGSEDERQQSEAAMFAADYFRRQAEGKLLPADSMVRKPKETQFIGEVDVHYTDDAPPIPPPMSSAGPSNQVFGLGQSQKAPTQKQGSADDMGEERGRSMGPDSSGRYPSASHSRERQPRPMPRYESIRHEFGPGSEDERQQPEAAISAADYFRRQAEGKLLPADGIVRKPKETQFIGEVDVHYTDGAPPIQPPMSSAGPSNQVFGLGQSAMGRPSHIRGRSTDQISLSSHPHRHSYHGPPVSYGDPFDFGPPAPFAQVPMSGGIAPSLSGSSSMGSQVPPKPAPPTPAPVSTTAMYEQHGADGKIKAFVCPLFSCGRLFKRMEHLKRHLRTHTMERPFTCPQCKKRFSRIDNLNQHLRTHDRTTGPTGTVSSNTAESGNGESAGASDSGNAEWSDSMDDEHEGSSGHHGDHSGGESEDEDWSRYTSLGDMNNQALGLSGMDLSSLGVPGSFAGDVQMRELEASDVREVQGDEEGLLMVANHGTGYYPIQSSSALFSNNTGDFGSDGAQWTRPQPSPAFSTISMPSPNMGSIDLRSNRNSIGSSPANYLQQLQGHSANPSMSSSYAEDFGAMSAPSSKATFDHSNMYTSNMVMDDSAGPGPIRRHRSMTPSHARNGEPIRRPGTANSTYFNAMGATPASVGSSPSTSSHRGYHPYTAGFNSASRSNSARSSPSLHNIKFGNAAEFGGHMRSSSKGSNCATPGPGVMQVQEQMKQMMSMGGGNSMSKSSTMSSAATVGTMNVTNIRGHSFHNSHVNITNHYETTPREAGTDINEQMLSWLDAPDFRKIYRWALEQRLGQTGTWFIETPEFQTFIKAKKTVLWVTGMPGAGKTVLGSTIVKHLEFEFQRHDDVGIAFAFLRYTEPQPTLKILAGLLSQLVTTKGRAHAEMCPVYQRVSKKGEPSEPTVTDFLEVLRAITASLAKVYIVLDGLDEASNDVKQALVHSLPQLDVNLFILSRPLDLYVGKVCQAVKVPLYAHADDIELYVTERIGQDYRVQAILRGKPDVGRKLRARIRTKSNGMFLVAKLQMDSIIAHSNNVDGLFRALDNLPSGVSEMYDHTMNRINAQTQDDVVVAHRVFVLLLQVFKAPRKPGTDSYRFPPSTDDIQDALALDVEKRRLYPDRRTDTSLIISACCGLVVLGEASDDSLAGQGPYKTLRFIHYSAPQYLEKQDIHGLRDAPGLSKVLKLVSEMQGQNTDVADLLPNPEVLVVPIPDP